MSTRLFQDPKWINCAQGSMGTCHVLETLTKLISWWLFIPPSHRENKINLYRFYSLNSHNRFAISPRMFVNSFSLSINLQRFRYTCYLVRFWEQPRGISPPQINSLTPFWSAICPHFEYIHQNMPYGTLLTEVILSFAISASPTPPPAIEVLLHVINTV